MFQNDLKHNYYRILDILKKFEIDHGLSQDVTLVAVSKKQSVESIQSLYSLGQRHFAENYVLELCDKSQLLKDLGVIWHFIGHIQSNKIKQIAQVAHWIHSLEKQSHAIKLNKDCGFWHREINVLIEVNISGEKNKKGLDQFSEIYQLAKVIQDQKHLKLRGLMGLASHVIDDTLLKSQFDCLKDTFENLKQKGFFLDTLSMGMSNDFCIALEKGSTMLRIGSLIFTPEKLKRKINDIIDLNVFNEIKLNNHLREVLDGGEFVKKI